MTKKIKDTYKIKGTYSKSKGLYDRFYSGNLLDWPKKDLKKLEQARKAGYDYIPFTW